MHYCKAFADCQVIAALHRFLVKVVDIDGWRFAVHNARKDDTKPPSRSEVELSFLEELTVGVGWNTVPVTPLLAFRFVQGGNERFFAWGFCTKILNVIDLDLNTYILSTEIYCRGQRNERILQH